MIPLPADNPKAATEGGLFGGADELYREVILDHFKSPRNRGSLTGANAKAEGTNPFCGDRITITALIQKDVLKDVTFEGHGCAISQASASMMTSMVKGKTLKEATALTSFIKKIFGVENASLTSNGAKPALTMDTIGDFQALEGVKKYPVRIKCALLSWNTLLQCLEEFKKT
ncbi:MAG: SUF system NifU family Fe-S cluster assembly protein [Elusimicrobia bacterium]|nr:SUF system NifU family Fe-S cluster assembly protein [Candidatus Obscuribacterium magneticum]